MKTLLDACVLFPTVMREVLVRSAKAGLFQPCWSARILEEWARAAGKSDPGQEAVARGEIALVMGDWPKACIAPSPMLERTLYLPDANDIHVLAAAISGGCTSIVTMNLKDFPPDLLGEHQMRAIHPDAFLLHLFNGSPDQIAEVVAEVHRQVERLSGQKWPVRKLLKKAQLPRLGKALERWP